MAQVSRFKTTHLYLYLYLFALFSDEEEQVAMEEWRAQARKELDDWYRHRDEQFQKAKALNRYNLNQSPTNAHLTFFSPRFTLLADSRVNHFTIKQKLML